MADYPPLLKIAFCSLAIVAMLPNVYRGVRDDLRQRMRPRKGPGLPTAHLLGE